MSDIAAIFALDPHSLTRSGPEIKAVIAEYRKARVNFNTGAKGSRAAGATKNVAPKMKLEDLDVE